MLADVGIATLALNGSAKALAALDPGLVFEAPSTAGYPQQLGLGVAQAGPPQIQLVGYDRRAPSGEGGRFLNHWSLALDWINHSSTPSPMCLQARNTISPAARASSTAS